MSDHYNHWKRVAHIPLIIILQIIFIILFAQFVVYDEHTAIKNVHFDKGFKGFQKDAVEGAQPEPQSKHDHGHDHSNHEHGSGDDIAAEKLVDKPLHETTIDAQETLTDYPSTPYLRFNSKLYYSFTFLLNFEYD